MVPHVVATPAVQNVIMGINVRKWLAFSRSLLRLGSALEHEKFV